jgi:hypothetical protein
MLSAQDYKVTNGAYHVFAPENLQRVLDVAATNHKHKTIFVHQGTYCPDHPRQALIYLNHKHDGIHLVGVGWPVLTVTNPKLANPNSPSYPAIANHVLYCGHGLSSNTVIEHFRLTGANHFVTNSFQDQMEPDRTLPKGKFYYGDGGAIKIYRRSYPVLRDLEIIDNYANPCAGGVSIQHEGENQEMVLIENCVFKNNRAEVTGGALDLLWGSSAHVVNCLFFGNSANNGTGEGFNPFTNNGAITVFPGSKLILERCTLTGNRNGVDDMGGLSRYERCVFTSDQLESGTRGQRRFELDLQRGGIVRDCVIKGRVLDPFGVISSSANVLNPPELELDESFVPKGPAFSQVGYRPPSNGQH